MQDWQCPSCNNNVFGSKSQCRCGHKRDVSSLMRPGDWQCPGCGGVVFASKDQCGKCRTIKPSARQPAPVQQQQFQQGGRPGDWNCPGCNGLVFASKDRCGKCGCFKPNPALAVAQPQQQTQERALPGDWMCSSCYSNNFASRQECYKCRAPRTNNQANNNYALPQSQIPNTNPFANSVNSMQNAPSPLVNSTNPFSASINVVVSNNDQFQNANPYSASAIQNNTNAFASNSNMGGVGEVKRGDWRCGACNENNFASRQACFKCRAAKPGNYVNMNASQQPAQQPAKFAGDWNCNCGAENFGSRVVCYKCAAPRPDTSNASSTNTDESDGLCVICLCEPYSMVIQNCGHLCLCAGCATNSIRHCPMCREPVRAIMKVFKV